MTHISAPAWWDKRTEESRYVEDLMRACFHQVDAYRYNSASIRVRVIDPRFEGLSVAQRDDMVEPYLEQLPERTQADIITLYTFAPSELQQGPTATRAALLNAEFEDPSPSML